MKESKKIIIAIDGYSSTGKSTLAKKLANELSYVYVDTGAMYRAIALHAMENNLINEENIDEASLVSNLEKIDIKFIFNSNLGFSEIYLNGRNVENEIRRIDVSNMVSKIAAISAVRKKMVIEQHRMGQNLGVVMDGRDIGTVVFPKAELKIFMTASADIRARRRYDEMIAKGDKVTFDSVLENVNTRDHLDTTRKDSPLRKANDAVEINSDHLDVQETFDLVYKKSKRENKEIRLIY
jgi:cytidylate kinase